MPPNEDTLSSLERARERLYEPGSPATPAAAPLPKAEARSLPHAWKEAVLPRTLTGPKRHVRLATLFLGACVAFFVLALLAAGAFFYLGGNSVSINKIDIRIQGPTTISGGDTVPLSLIIVNKNPIAIDDATVSIDFPAGTRDAANVLEPYQRYSENLGTIPSGGTVTRSVNAVVFGAAGEALTLPVSLSYSAAGSNAVFVKKLAYALTITSTPLSVSVNTVSETVSGQPITLTLNVRSNATIPIDNVAVAGVFPFGFSVTSSSQPLSNSVFYVGSLDPGASKTITLTGTLSGQNSEQRVFRFTVGTSRAANDPALAVTYMSQDASVLITAPFIATALSVNGDASPNIIVSPGGSENVTVSYTNTLSTTVTNATVTVALSGNAIDYGTIETSNGFYNSANRSVIFSRDSDAAFESLSPGASGIGSFTFSTLPANKIGSAPSLTLTTSVSGTRIGQTNVPEEVSATSVKTIKVATGASVAATARRTSDSSGPVPPQAGESTSYTVEWGVRNGGSTVAGGTVRTTLPGYVSYEGADTNALSYDPSSRMVTWNLGDLSQGKTASASFTVSLTPSTSQIGSAPELTGPASFSGYDRFAGVQITANAQAVTTETDDDRGVVE